VKAQFQSRTQVSGREAGDRVGGGSYEERMVVFLAKSPKREGGKAVGRGGGQRSRPRHESIKNRGDRRWVNGKNFTWGDRGVYVLKKS